MRRLLLVPLVLALLAPLRAQEKTPASETPAAEPAASEFEARPVQSLLEAQVELHRRGFSCGSIDGVRGAQTAAALKAFQRSAGLKETGDLDMATREALLLTEPALGEHSFTPEELASLHPVPDTWVGKSELERLGHATALELAAERHRANPKLLRQLNPDFDWEHLLPGATVQVPNVGTVLLEGKAALLHVRLSERELEVTDPDGKLIAHFPVSIAKMAEKRPVGELVIKVVIPDPNYTFDPAVFPESQEAQTLDHKLILPPGPNNPVGVAWIGLDRPGYGIHGTPEPEKVGRTESHGCFRLANWDARTLLALVDVGLPVVVEP
ncbi:MAG: murein L,D-transpeptidase [Opitutae bacterium]|nr:murein L,D-transpeptidase [Opitutae bacterium]